MAVGVAALVVGNGHYCQIANASGRLVGSRDADESQDELLLWAAAVRWSGS